MKSIQEIVEFAGGDNHFKNRLQKFLSETLKEYETDGTYHHKEGPDCYKSTHYYDENNEYHRDNGLPAVENPEYLMWFVHGKPYRENDLPTKEYTDGGTKIWADENDELHRLTGPAYIVYYPDENYHHETYWIHGVEHTKEEFDKINKTL